MRSEEFAAGSGSRFHPNVLHYRDGGMGGIGEDRSVVGMVPTHVLLGLREYDRTDSANHPGSAETIDSLRADLRSGVGFREPAVIEYDHHTGWAYLGEGNHRVAAAAAEGVPEVPARVVRGYTRSMARRRSEGVGAPATHSPIPGTPANYIPTDIHPSYLRFQGSHEAKDIHTEIADLLTPNWGRQ